jgi:hypothetical protein
MSNLSTANSTDISSLIGALELNDRLTSIDDGVLETAGASVALSPGQLPPTFLCR